ncbi:MAG TPA: GNAT family N-acetyltransferase [Rhabdochlamydiaceae bacterium]|jgi:RimJ/RimL family protein N-acetyltransferase|nr:GNAT family N-acetyltransferase [Rhabdochlamydiaceae bacterium]
MSIPAVSDLDTAIADFFQKGSPITIETKDLSLRSITEKDLDFMQTVYTDFETMRLYTDNEKRLEQSGEEAWKAEQMKAAKGRVDTFVKRWTVDRIPFSGFLISKKDGGKNIGFIVAGFGDNPGQLETAFVVIKEEQGKGYGSQAVHAVVQRYIPALIETHYKINGKPLEADGAPLTEIVATARLDNVASIRVQEKAGMVKTGENPNKWGQVRGIYTYKYTNPPVKV